MACSPPGNWYNRPGNADLLIPRSINAVYSILMKELIAFIFPVHCPVCGKLLEGTCPGLCVSCEYGMPRTLYARVPGNPVSQLFWGRVPILEATSLYRFEKGSPYQELLHDLKYRGNRNMGIYLGRLLGRSLIGTVYSGCDLLIPVPLHRKRLRERGYNQSAVIARGVSDVTGIPAHEGVLLRSVFHTSQTTRGRIGRYENVQSGFRLSPDPPDLQGKKILLVDDVVTTGATLEACAGLLDSSFSCSIYAATISCA